MQEEAATSFRLSPQQEALWTSEPNGPIGGAQLTVEIQGPLDRERLRGALRELVARHEILRTTFQRRAGVRLPLQAVHESLEPEWREIDLRDLSPAEQADQLGEVAAAADVYGWRYEEGPLISADLVALADGRHALVLTIAPPCTDAASLTTIVRDLTVHYGGGATLNEPLQYADFAEWQHELLESSDDEAAAAQQFWVQAARDAGGVVPFLQRAMEGAAGAVDVAVSAETRAAVNSAAERYGLTPAAIARAAWHVVLDRLSQDERVPIASISPRRVHPELETAVGLFVRGLPLHVGSSGTPTFAEVAVQLDQSVEMAARWQDYAPTGDAGAVVGFVEMEPVAVLALDGLTFTCTQLTPPVLFPLALEWGADSCRVRFTSGALDRGSAERIAGYMCRVLAAAAGAPEAAIDTFDLLGEEDMARLTVEVNQTAAPAPACSVDKLIAAAASAAPDRDAVVDEHGAVTYAELDARGNQLAHRLRRSGIGPDSVVALCTNRSVEMVVGLLGILKAGAAYLPLNFEHPAARVLHQLAETGCSVIVTQEALLERLPPFGGELVCLDRDRVLLDEESTMAPAVGATMESLAYVIYTSGSTGQPKGVGVTHASLANYVQAIGRQLEADEQPLAFGMVTAISTDLGNTALFPALCTGGTLVLVSPAAAADAAAMTAFLEAHPVDVLKITPSHLNALTVGADAARILPRRWLIVGGEPLSWDLVTRVRDLGECQVLNHYGPTETTVGSCTFLVDNGPGPYAPATVPIGTPIANTRCYVLDERGRCVPEGVAGELYIAGAGVARGYVGQPGETADRFRPDPFIDAAGERMYATGDLVRRLPDASIEFLGRRDDQLKIRGFRVEPAEIETALRSHPDLLEAVVVAREDGRGERRLVAYVVAENGVEVDDLHRYLEQHVPDFMIPSAFAVVVSLPRTASGKIDRLALPEPERAEVSRSGSYVAPRTPVEEKVAAIWADVLGVERVGVEDDFFALGGHSLLATQIVAQVRSDFSIDLPLHALFTSPTVATLSTQIVDLMGEAADGETEQLLAALEGMSDEETLRLLAVDAEPEQ